MRSIRISIRNRMQNSKRNNIGHGAVNRNLLVPLNSNMQRRELLVWKKVGLALSSALQFKSSSLSLPESLLFICYDHPRSHLL